MLHASLYTTIEENEGDNMESMKLYKEEKGQALLLIAVGLVVLLGFTALAVDGGMIYADRRFDQNAADASSYAGAGAAAMAMENSQITYRSFSCTAPAGSTVANKMNFAKSEAVKAAKARAANNNFSIESGVDNQHGVEVLCGTETKAGGAYMDKFFDIRTMISSDLKTSFAHLFYKGAIRNTVDAVVRVRPRNDLAFGFAIASLSSDCKKGIDFNGDSNVQVHLTGIFSNSCITTNGGVNIKVNPVEQGINYVDEKKINGSGSIDPLPTKVDAPIPRIPVPTPDCDHPSLIDGGKINSGGTIKPGRYQSIKVNAGNTLLLSPGLYCMDGDLTALGGTLMGNGVTIYQRQGSFDVGGNVTVQLSAPTAPAEPALRGMLFYAAEGNANAHKMSGGGASWYIGTLYAPDGSIELGGNNSINPTYTTQVVADYVKIHGTADMEIYFNDTLTYQIPSFLESWR
jgi:hypothetical protein